MTAQSYVERPPAPQLAPYVASVFVQRVAHDAPPYRHRTVPNGSAEIVCHVGALPQLVGPRTGPDEDVLAPGSVVVGVRFHPGAAPAVLGVPASELVDLTLDLDDLPGFEGDRLAEAVVATGSAAVLERAVAGRLAATGAGPDPIATEAVRLLAPWRGGDVGSLTSALYVSERQLRRRLHAAIGLGPKALQRMLRYQGFLALAQVHAHASGELARLAAEVGYADQAHLTRESLRLAGRSPREVLREAKEHCTPSHDHAASYGPLLAARRAGTRPSSRV